MLYLLPNLLAETEDHSFYLPAAVDAYVATLTDLIAESEKGARHFLRRFAFAPPKTFRDIKLHVLNEHTTLHERRELAAQVGREGVWGLISDAGMPCLADPGADIVQILQRKGVPVKAVAGPSSLILALVLSGLGGQNFSFHGYLPREEAPLTAEIKRLEKISQKEGSTHLFIETPYRNERLFAALIASLSDETLVSIALSLTEPEERVETRKVGEWKKRELPALAKKPCVFLFKNPLTP